MAEHGAHITSAGEADRPTIFEVLAQESLMTTVRPALKHAVKVLAENRPERFGWLLRYYDEVYSCMDFLIENYHLRKYYGSFAENFYDLKRVPASNIDAKLSPKHHWASVFLLVAVPYMKTKLDQLFEDLRHRYGADRRSQKSADTVPRMFLYVYPYIHMLWEGACLTYQLTYMLGRGTCHSPFLHLSGTRLRHLDQFDLDAAGSKMNIDWTNKSMTEKFQMLVRRVVGVAAFTLSSGLSVGMFFLQFLEWWYASDNKAASLTALPIPDPPTVSDASDGRELSPFLCPVCGRTRTNETALSVSGYVFCYPCIHGFIKQHGRCPVTDYPATQDHLIKLYLTDS